MRTQQIVKFLAVQKDLPEYLRERIVGTHRGRWPTWRAHALKRGVNQIVEVATWCRERRNRFAVLRWYWNDGGFGLSTKSFATLREARENTAQTLRIDALHVDLGA